MHRNVTTHALPLNSGRLVAPGDTCEPNPESAHDEALIRDRQLVPAQSGRKRKTKTEKEG